MNVTGTSASDALICAWALSARGWAAEGDEPPARPQFGLDLGFLGGVELLHGNLPDDVAFLYGGDLKLRLTFVSLGVRLEKSAEFSSRNITFTRWLGTVGFNIAAGHRTEISPYLGFGSLDPMIATARDHGAGVFVLALTSNPEAPPFQHARTAAGPSVAGTVLAELAGLNKDVAAMGSFGAVVGATIEDTDEDLAINGPLLVPGIGAQGGTADDVRRIFGNVLDQVLPASSREILSAGPDAGALHDAVGRSVDAFTALRAGR